MKNIFIIIVIVLSMVYMFVILFDKYENTKKVNEQINKTKMIENKTTK